MLRASCLAWARSRSLVPDGEAAGRLQLCAALLGNDGDGGDEAGVGGGRTAGGRASPPAGSGVYERLTAGTSGGGAAAEAEAALVERLSADGGAALLAGRTAAVFELAYQLHGLRAWAALRALLATPAVSGPTPPTLAAARPRDCGCGSTTCRCSLQLAAPVCSQAVAGFGGRGGGGRAGLLQLWVRASGPVGLAIPGRGRMAPVSTLPDDARKTCPYLELLPGDVSSAREMGHRAARSHSNTRMLSDLGRHCRLRNRCSRP